MSDQPDALSDDEADALAERLADAIDDTDAVPPWLTRFAYESHRLVSLEGELAELTLDTLVDSASGMRSGEEGRSLEFTLPPVGIRMDVEGDTVRGSVEPTGATVHVVRPDEREAVDVNNRGFFTFTAPHGPFRLVADFGDRAVRTDWITLR